MLDGAPPVVVVRTVFRGRVWSTIPNYQSLHVRRCWPRLELALGLIG